jgi:hypothetical protein
MAVYEPEVFVLGGSGLRRAAGIFLSGLIDIILTSHFSSLSIIGLTAQARCVLRC